MALRSLSDWGWGTGVPIGAPASGVVPQVAMGRMAAPSMTTSLSKLAPGSVASFSHSAVAAS